MTANATPSRAIAGGTIFFDPADGIYTEHFPGHPVVPGTLIVCAFLRAAGELRPDFPCRHVENFGFRQFVQPGEYPFTMEDRAEGVICRLYKDGKIMAEGTIKK